MNRPVALTPPARPWTVRNRRPAVVVAPRAAIAPAAPLDTRYTLSYLDARGQIVDRHRAGPSTPMFTDAFAALARGTLITTPEGHIAVEDLLPGDRVVTQAGVATLRWKGSRSIAPQHRALPLFRIPNDQLGPGRPTPDLVVGPGARLVSRRSALRTLIGDEAALVPISALADGESVLRIRPVSTMQVYQLGFARHAIYTANGVEVDSVYPDRLDPASTPELLALFMSMFPYLDRPGEFGALAMPRLEGEMIDRMIRIA